MKRLLIGLVLLITGCNEMLVAQTLQDFIRIYDSYLAAVKTGDYQKVSAFLLFKDNGRWEQEEFMKDMEQLRPVRYRTASLTISEDGQSAELQLSGRCDYWDGQTRPLTDSEKAELRRNPPPTQGCYVPLSFVKDHGQWKMSPAPRILGEGRPGGAISGK